MVVSFSSPNYPPSLVGSVFSLRMFFMSVRIFSYRVYIKYVFTLMTFGYCVGVLCNAKNKTS